ncbi:hypothetical protein ZIOFF_063037 [Zingiber officinale]|uniref:AP2/ERF domain-containing protein n=1 Tax=Zingiber officinale TaxID=94328 RepID=A0A8J5F1B8_ZINOF|nr:hypothetical protein ZIOFF_063037 [Zingiber officinale]
MDRVGETSGQRSGQAPAPAKYKGVRLRKWGKWVAEVRYPKSRKRLWLGSFPSPVMAARAYDAAMLCLRGRAEQHYFNFPDQLPDIAAPEGMSQPEIKEKAVRIVQKVLRSLPEKYFSLVTIIEQTRDLKSMTLEDLQGILKAHECSHCHKPGHKATDCWFKQEDDKKTESGLIHQSKNEETLLLASNDNKVDEMWYLDSGASKHMIDASFDDPKGKANEIYIPSYSEQESEEDNSSHSPSSSTSPPRKMRSVQELLDSTEPIEYDDSVLFAFFAGEESISFDDANKEEDNEQKDDIFTKPLGGPTFTKIVASLGMKSKFGLREALLEV